MLKCFPLCLIFSFSKPFSIIYRWTSVSQFLPGRRGHQWSSNWWGKSLLHPCPHSKPPQQRPRATQASISNRPPHSHHAFPRAFVSFPQTPDVSGPSASPRPLGQTSTPASPQCDAEDAGSGHPASTARTHIITNRLVLGPFPFLSLQPLSLVPIFFSLKLQT